MSKRDALLEATQALLWERGYDATSPRQILERSQAGQGSLYHHFRRGKKELALTALEAVEANMTAAFEQLFDPKLPIIERVERYIGAPRDALKGCPLGRLAGDVTTTTDAELRQPAERFFQHAQTRIAQALTDAVDEGEIELSGRPDEVAAALLAVVQGGYILSRLSNDSALLRTAIRGALTLFREAATVPAVAVEQRWRYALPVVSLGV